MQMSFKTEIELSQTKDRQVACTSKKGIRLKFAKLLLY